MLPIQGKFYQFHRRRVISRPGQPLLYGHGIEIGPLISSEDALREARSGYDVYTLAKTDAYRLASALNRENPIEHPATNSVFFAHYHPGGEHLEIDQTREGRHKSIGGPGHIFFGSRGGD